jgi:hypothetical protein
VLQEFSDSEDEALAQALGRASAAAEVFATDGIAAAMDRFNAPVPAEDPTPEEGGGT